MKMTEALKIIDGEPGFMVTFEHVRGGMLESDFFPDIRNGEDPIKTEFTAWEWARRFAEKTRGRCVNIYVINRSDFSPVHGYRERMIENR